MTETLLNAVLLGVVQGLTEFLPVSSSGHLTLIEHWVKLPGDNILFNLVLHVGTLIPVVWFYRSQVAVLVRDPIRGEGPFLERQGVKEWILLIAASIPTAVIGLVFKDTFEALFANPGALAVTFTLTALIMLSTRFTTPRGRALTVGVAVLLGIVQGFAITPGISRSGSTIAMALLLGCDREEAARFSFLMSVPAITGATLLMFKDADFASLDFLALGVGFVSALVSGYLALILLVALVKRGGLYLFSAWCFGAAAVAYSIA